MYFFTVSWVDATSGFVLSADNQTAADALKLANEIMGKGRDVIIRKQDDLNKPSSNPNFIVSGVGSSHSD